MAKVLERQETLYDQDLLAWAEQQAAHLRAGQLVRLDVEHLSDELGEVAGSCAASSRVACASPWRTC